MGRRISGAVGRIDEDGKAIGKIETAADDEAHAARARRFERAHDAGERIAIDDAERFDAEFLRPGEELIAAAGATQKAEMACHLQLGIARAHPNIP